MWRAVGARGKLWAPREDGVSEAPEPMGRDREVGMAIADVVSGKVTEPLGIRALVAERTVEPDDVFDLGQCHGARMVDLKFRRVFSGLRRRRHGRGLRASVR